MNLPGSGRLALRLVACATLAAWAAGFGCAGGCAQVPLGRAAEPRLVLRRTEKSPPSFLGAVPKLVIGVRNMAGAPLDLEAIDYRTQLDGIAQPERRKEQPFSVPGKGMKNLSIPVPLRFTDFMDDVNNASVPGNFSKVKRGILVTI